ncbi:MAG: PEP-CTERM sorting domain-containing protein [Burkholderiales bacterium]|nr:PEP-CTERM sorting domain-containing protein [Burkholderiales bacterium]
MQFQLKAIVAAAALAGFAGSAGAAIDNGSTGNGSLFLNVYDSVAGVSFVKDLGISVADFAPTQGVPAYLNFDLSGDQDWTTFVSLTTAGNVAWNVVALGDTRPVSPGSTAHQIYYSTTPDAVETIDNTRNSQLKQFFITNSYVQAVNPLLDAENGSAVHVAEGSADFSYFGFGFQDNWGGKATFSSVGALDAELAFYKLSLGGTGANLTNIVVTPYEQTWLLSSDGTLTYGVAAVPEPETWALLGLGLAGIGFAVRRRKTA